MQIKEGKNSLIIKLKKDHASLSHNLSMFILGLFITIPTFFDNEGIVATIIFSVLTLYHGARALYLFKNKREKETRTNNEFK